MNYTKLKTELQNVKYSTMTDAEAATDLNLVNVVTKQPITAHNIRKYLMLISKLVTLEASSDPSAIEAVRALEVFPNLDISEPAVSAKLTSILSALVTATLLTEAEKVGILSMGDKTVSRAEELGVGKVRERDTRTARGQI